MEDLDSRYSPYDAYSFRAKLAELAANIDTRLDNASKQKARQEQPSGIDLPVIIESRGAYYRLGKTLSLDSRESYYSVQELLRSPNGAMGQVLVEYMFDIDGKSVKQINTHKKGGYSIDDPFTVKAYSQIAVDKTPNRIIDDLSYIIEDEHVISITDPKVIEKILEKERKTMVSAAEFGKRESAELRPWLGWLALKNKIAKI